MRRLKRLFAFGAALALATPALSHEWAGLVVGQTGPDAPTAFADAFYVSNALTSGGLSPVEMLRDQPQRDILVAIEGFAGASRAVIYVSAPLTKDGDGLALKDEPLSFETLLEEVAKAGVQELALMIESCPSQGRSPDLPSPKNDMSMFVAFSAGPGEVCPVDGGRLTDLLQQDIVTPLPLDLILSDVWFFSDLQELPRLHPTEQRPDPVVTVMGVRDAPMAETVVSRAAVSMLGPLTIAPVTATREPVAYSPAATSSRPVALPVAEGLPQPSIIVGIVSEATRASFTPAVTLGDVTGNEVGFDNLNARRAMRQQDFELYARLVESGAFDPSSDVIAAALQTELARMGCYNGGIDGVWGRGSRGSVQRYFDQRTDAQPVSLEPVVGLFRQMILDDDVVCPAVARAAAASTPVTRTRTTTARRTTQQAAPARTQQPSTRTISNSNRLGVFR